MRNIAEQVKTSKYTKRVAEKEGICSQQTRIWLKSVTLWLMVSLQFTYKNGSCGNGKFWIMMNNYWIGYHAI